MAGIVAPPGQRALTIVVHGESGSGKSWFADSAPAPRLVLDVEGGIRFTPSKKVAWDPRGEPPAPNGWDTAVVTVTDLDTLRATFQWLTLGRHPFRSVIIDSLTEAQKRAVDNIAGTAQMKLQDYGALLRQVEAIVRSFRDLTINPVKPVEVVVFVCGSQEKGQEHAVVRPALVGAMATQLPYYVDIMGYMALELGPEGELERRMLFANVDNIAAKDRTGRLGVAMVSPSVPKLLNAVFGEINEEER